MRGQAVSLREVLGLAAVTVAGFWLRWASLDEDDVWLDEVLTTVFAHLPYSTLLFDVPDVHPPLNVLLYKAFVLPSTDPIAIRSLPLLFGTLCLPAMYVLGRIIGGASVAFWSTALLAAWALHMDYSQEARAYALLFLVMTLSASALAAAFNRPADRRLPFLVGYAVLGALTVHVHFIAVFWVALSAGLLFLDDLLSADRRRPTRPVILTLGLLGILVLPALLQLYVGYRLGAFSWLQRPDGGALLTLLHDVYGFSGLGWGTLPAGMLIVGALFAGLWLAYLGRWQHGLLIIGLTLLPAAMYLASFLKPVLLPRTALLGVAGAALALGTLLARLPVKLAVGIATAIIALNIASFHARPEYRPEYERSIHSLANYLEENASTADKILFSDTLSYGILRYHLKDDLDVPIYVACYCGGGIMEVGAPVAETRPWQHWVMSQYRVPIWGNPFESLNVGSDSRFYEIVEKSGATVWLVALQVGPRLLSPTQVAERLGAPFTLVTDEHELVLWRMTPSRLVE
ncbi:MAG: hypothetical protein AAGI34_18385 [Pseudomonadota bacterium]